MAMESLQENNNGETKFNLKFMPLSSIQDGIKVTTNIIFFSASILNETIVNAIYLN